MPHTSEVESGVNPAVRLAKKSLIHSHSFVTDVTLAPSTSCVPPTLSLSRTRLKGLLSLFTISPRESPSDFYFKVVISFLAGLNGALDLVAPLFERLRVFPIPSKENCLLRIHAVILGVTQGRSPWWARVRVSGKNRSIASQMTLLKWANLSKQEFSEKNPKYHHSYLFFFTINKGDLPLMYSCAFWCEFIDLVVFFGCYCLTPVAFFVLWRINEFTPKNTGIHQR